MSNVERFMDPYPNTVAAVATSADAQRAEYMQFVACAYCKIYRITAGQYIDPLSCRCLLLGLVMLHFALLSSSNTRLETSKGVVH